MPASNVIQSGMDSCGNLLNGFAIRWANTGWVHNTLLPQLRITGFDDFHQLAFPFALVDLAQTQLQPHWQTKESPNDFGGFFCAFQVAGVYGDKRLLL